MTTRHKEYVEVNGVRHGIVVVPAHDPAAPIVLFAHGGPGSPILPLLHARGFDLRDLATFVFWDQRGAGMSARGVDARSLSLDQLADDAVAITRHVLGTLDRERAVLMGHSWGSYLGAVTVARAPGQFTAFVGVGQVNSLAGSDTARLTFYREQAERRGDHKTAATLDELTGRDLSNDRRWATIHEQQGALTGTGMLRGGYRRADIIRDIIRCRPYTWRERLAVLPGTFRSHGLYREIYDAPLAEVVPRLDVPVHVFAGRHDYLTPMSEARTYFEQVEAPEKTWTEFTESAHSPFVDEPAQFRTALAAVLGNLEKR